MLLSTLCIVFLLSAQISEGKYVRRRAEESSDIQPLVPGALPPGFGFDDKHDTSNNQDSPDGDQGIRNGFAVAPLPWYVVFQGRTLCGGSLIHGDIALTAAHCVDDNGLPNKVRVGSNDYFTGGRVSKVLDGVLHPGWSWKKASDPDLAILLLEDFLHIQVAQVNSDNNIPVDSHPSIFAMGFGLTNDKHTSRTLLGASIPYLDNCSYQSYTYNKTRHLCADSKDVATCGGDSGSPITLGMSSSLQVGINSYSNGKCSSQTLDIYTRVSFFYQWIQEKVCEMSAAPPEHCFAPSTSPTPPPSTSPTPAPTASTTTVNPSAAPTESESSYLNDMFSTAPTETASSSPSDTSSITPTDAPSVLPSSNPTQAPTATEPPVGTNAPNLINANTPTTSTASPSPNTNTSTYSWGASALTGSGSAKTLSPTASGGASAPSSPGTTKAPTFTATNWPVSIEEITNVPTIAAT